MKKILQYSLYALMACGFVEVNASDVHQPEALSEVAPGQTASEQRLAEIKASLPSVIDAYDALLKSSADHPVTDANYAILCDYIMKLKDCSKEEISKVMNEFFKIERDMSTLANQLIIGQLRVPNGGIDSVITTWGGLPGRPIKEWIKLSKVLWRVSLLVSDLAHGDDCEIPTGDDEYRAYSNIASILSSRRTSIPAVFPQANCCFLLKARRAFESDQDYISQIHKLNELYQSGASKRIMISIDGEESAQLLSGQLNLPEKTVVERVTITGTKDHPLHVTSALLQAIRNIIRFAPNVEYVWVTRAILGDGAAFCDFLKDYGAHVVTFEHVDSSLLRGDADNIGPRLLGTSIESFSENNPAISDADSDAGRVANACFWTTYLPQTIEELFLDLYECPYEDEENEAVLKIFRTALNRYPRMHTFRSDPNVATFDKSEPNGMRLDIETMAYMALHPSLKEAFLTEEESLKEAIRKAAPHTEAEALANVLMAFSKYRQILNKPYEYVGLLMDTLRETKDLRAELRATNPGEDKAISESFVEATSQFRAAVEAKYNEFAALNKDALNNAFRKLIRQETLSLVPRILQLSENKTQQLIDANTAQPGSKKRNRPQQVADDEAEPPLKK